MQGVLTTADLVGTVAYSPDGKVLAHAGYDGVIRLVDRTGRQLAGLSGHTGPVNGVTFSWRDPRELSRSVCDILPQGVSRADWKQYAADIPYRRSCP